MSGSLKSRLHLNIPEVWLRFVLALLGLGLAFTSALFSTVAREAGNLYATIGLASAALLLATIVGLTTIPYLARRVFAERMRNAFDYDVTFPGIVYVLLTVVLGIAALNTGNNLLYIVVAVMLAAIIVSGFASAQVLRDLELDVRVPEHVFAGRIVPARLILRNLSRWRPSFSVRVSAMRAPQSVWKRKSPLKKDLSIFQQTAYFLFLAPQQELRAELELKFASRGRYRETGFGLATRFPFAFVTKTRRVELAREIVVYPAVDAARELVDVLPMITGEFETFTRGRGFDLYRIREYLPEDSARHVDWKASAKSGSLKVREFSREDEPRLRIVFDNPAPGSIPAASYEAAVQLAASTAWHFANEDVQVSFLAAECDAGEELYRFLEYLALVQPKAEASVLESLPESQDYNLILTTRSHSALTPFLAACSYVIELGQPPALAATNEETAPDRSLGFPRG